MHCLGRVFYGAVCDGRRRHCCTHALHALCLTWRARRGEAERASEEENCRLSVSDDRDATVAVWYCGRFFKGARIFRCRWGKKEYSFGGSAVAAAARRSGKGKGSSKKYSNRQFRRLNNFIRVSLFFNQTELKRQKGERRVGDGWKREEGREGGRD